MRLAKDIYWVYLDKFGASNVGDILIPVNGVYLRIDDVPNAYVEEVFGYSKEEFYDMIMEEVETSEIEESLNDL